MKFSSKIFLCFLLGLFFLACGSEQEATSDNDLIEEPNGLGIEEEKEDIELPTIPSLLIGTWQLQKIESANFSLGKDELGNTSREFTTDGLSISRSAEYPDEENSFQIEDGIIFMQSGESEEIQRLTTNALVLIKVVDGEKMTISYQRTRD